MVFCLNWGAFVAAQIRYMEHAIAENKWYLSEVAEHDVGLEVATEDFRQCHLLRVAGEFRAAFCTVLCPVRFDCELAPLIEELNDNWAR